MDTDKTFWTTFLVVISAAFILGQLCLRRQFSGSSFVCECNATYCDEIYADDKPPAGHFFVYVTDKNENRFGKYIMPFDDKQKNEAKSFVINVTSTGQTILGFGGTFTDATGKNIANLPTATQDKLIQAYFGPTGIEYNLGRIPIASNDMSTDIYSYDFTAGDTGLSKFTISGYDHLYKIPYIEKAVLASRHKVLLFGSPWCSPDWMKSNDNMVGYGTIAANMSKVYANYLARFLQEYEGFMEHGRMWGLTPQSGPFRSCDNTSSQPQYQSLCWTPNQMRDWVVKDLKASLNEYGYGYIKLMVMDDRIDKLPVWTKAFDDPDARAAIDGFAVQWYNQSSNSSRDLQDNHNKYPDKFILNSEASLKVGSKTLTLGSWEDAEEYTLRILQDLSNQVTGFVDYNMAVNMNGGPSWVENYGTQSPIVVNDHDGVFYKQPSFYAMGQFSKFIPPGSKVVAVKSTSSATSGLLPIAFLRPDGATVAVVTNFQNKHESILLYDGRNYINFKLTMNSINTFVWYH